MKTEALISMLSRGEIAVDSGAVVGRYALALGWGAFGATLIMATVLGVRQDLADALRLPMFWVKLAFPAALVAAALVAVLRLSRPGAALGRVVLGIAAPVIAIWILAALSLLAADPAAVSRLIFGDTWRSCPAGVGMISIPMFVAALWAMKGLAPTRLTLAGAAAGLLAGAAGALVYALHCPEAGAPFIAIWYLLGMLIPAGAGAALGPYLLRW